MAGPRRWFLIGILASTALALGRAEGSGELKLSKDFLDPIVEKLPPCPFDKADRYRGSVHSFRLNAIEARTRRLLIGCQIEGEFHPPVSGPISERVGRSPDTQEGWRKFHFEVKASVNIEPGPKGAPRFRIEIDEVKRRELDGFSGVVARFLGQYFDELVTQIAGGRASKLNRKLNDEILKRVTLFKDYGVLCGIDYKKTEITLHFDATRFQLEGITGYVFADATSGHHSPRALAAPEERFTLLHDHPACPRPAQLGQRWRLLPCVQFPGSRIRCCVPLACPPRRFLHHGANR